MCRGWTRQGLLIIGKPETRGTNRATEMSEKLSGGTALERIAQAWGVSVDELHRAAPSAPAARQTSGLLDSRYRTDDACRQSPIATAGRLAAGAGPDPVPDFGRDEDRARHDDQHALDDLGGLHDRMPARDPHPVTIASTYA